MSETKKPAYLIAQIKFKNFEESVSRYGQYAMPLMMKSGAEFLVGSPMAKAVEDSWDGNWLAVVKFPDMAAAEAFYYSPEYEPLKNLRINELMESGKVMLVEGFDPSVMGM